MDKKQGLLNKQHQNNKNKKPIGRPSIYSEEFADIICERIATNPIGLEHICNMYEDMPDPATIRKWIYRMPGFRTKYLEAKAEQSIVKIDQIGKGLGPINSQRSPIRGPKKPKRRPNRGSPKGKCR